MNNADHLASCLALSFGVSESEARSLSRASSERWDSLKHIEVLYLLEDEFDVVPAPDEMAGLDSFDALLALIERSR